VPGTSQHRNPALFGLYSLVTLWANTLVNADTMPRQAAWYRKTRPTFSDAIAAVRRQLWLPGDLCISTQGTSSEQCPPDLVNRMADALCFAA
jgi:hypothetical protein